MSVRDPRNQSEDLGDNAMKAGYYGIENLKRVLSKLPEWTKEANKDYSGLEEMNQQVIEQYFRYIIHVLNNIGLYTSDYKTVEEPGNTINFIPKVKQKEAVQFLQDQLFTTPYWLMNKQVYAKVGGAGNLFLPRSIQVPVLNQLLSYRMYIRLMYFQGQDAKNAYSFDELLNDLEKGIWKELTKTQSIDFCRRLLQTAYAERLMDLWDPYKNANGVERVMEAYAAVRSDMPTIVAIHIRRLVATIDKVLPGYKDQMSREHLLRVKSRLKEALKKNSTDEEGHITSLPQNAFADKLLFDINGTKRDGKKQTFYLNCWEGELPHIDY